jgi:hypothetical protein
MVTQDANRKISEDAKQIHDALVSPGHHELAFKIGIVARWHDESHWNRYLIDHPPSLVLSPSYCCYPDGRSAEFEPRISVVLKDAALMRK